MARGSPDPDHQRLQDLLDEHAERVRLAMLRFRLAQHGIDPAEIEQQVRIRLWKAIQRDRSAEFRASYIQRTVASVVIDAMRRAKVRPSTPAGGDEQLESECMDARAAQPDAAAGDAQHVRILLRCLDELPSQRRLAVSLRLEGHSFREVGELIGTSEEAARKLAARGLKTLRTRLRESGVDTDET